MDAGSQWSILDKYELDNFEHGTALKVMYLTDVSLSVCASDSFNERGHRLSC